MTISEAAVFIVDDDSLIRDSLKQLVKSAGLQADTFSSAQAFLEEELPDKPSCLILDIRMPGLTGRRNKGISTASGDSGRKINIVLSILLILIGLFMQSDIKSLIFEANESP
ncbi:MAG: response regulator [Thermodesulfobacteriota bacterium]|nr:response regulator [Thermodesulfobacteriota bacterium]